MTERPILFSGPMVRAILEGRKTQTRRVCKDPLGPSMMDDCPYGEARDRLWVRESFQPLFAEGVKFRDTDWQTGKGYAIRYVATDGRTEWMDPDDRITDRCKPGIHMPRWASRITLEIVSIRIERVQDISQSDVEAEGIKRYRREFGQDGGFPEGWEDSRPGYGGSVWILSAFKDAYRVLWDSINLDRGFGWEKNPWVWVVEFKRPVT